MANNIVIYDAGALKAAQPTVDANGTIDLPAGQTVKSGGAAAFAPAAHLTNTTDGQRHVPATGTTNVGRSLIAGATEGSLLYQMMVYDRTEATQHVDWNTLTNPGFYIMESGQTNAPEATNFYYLETILDGAFSNYCMQRATQSSAAGTVYVRNMINNVWGSWQIVGPQTAAMTIAALQAATLTGTLAAQANTSYTTAQLRNVILSTADASGGNNGDIWIKYTA